ncbi:hypothetical protein BC833DRAFT_564671 [Globomyces pollinis-pini]|nr:hypothetical protein BC833DRAFT_564671 [Globomyces pollinis-pini]
MIWYHMDIRILLHARSFVKISQSVKKRGKEKDLSEKTHFVPMPKYWPGKISQDDLFSEFSIGIRNEIHRQNQNPLVTLRVIQLDFKHHDFIITIPKSSTIFRVQCEIARIQHDGSVNQKDVIIFLQEPRTPATLIKEKKGENKEESIFSEDINSDPSSLSIGIPESEVCTDILRPLTYYFPEIKSFQLPPSYEKTTIPTFLHQIPFTKLTTENQSQFRQIKAASGFDYPTPSYPIFYDILPYIRTKRYIRQKTLDTSTDRLIKPFDFAKCITCVSQSSDSNLNPLNALIQPDNKRLTPKSITNYLPNIYQKNQNINRKSIQSILDRVPSKLPYMLSHAVFTNKTRGIGQVYGGIKDKDDADDINEKKKED